MPGLIQWREYDRMIKRRWLKWYPHLKPSERLKPEQVRAPVRTSVCRRETDRKTASGQRLGWRRAAGNRCLDYIYNIWSILMYNSAKAIEGMTGERWAQRQCEMEYTEGCVTAVRRTESWILIFVAEQMKVLNQNEHHISFLFQFLSYFKPSAISSESSSLLKLVILECATIHGLYVALSFIFLVLHFPQFFNIPTQVSGHTSYRALLNWEYVAMVIYHAQKL